MMDMKPAMHLYEAMATLTLLVVNNFLFSDISKMLKIDLYVCLYNVECTLLCMAYRLSCIHLSPVSPVPSPPLSSALVQGGDYWATATVEVVSHSSDPVLPVSTGIRWLWWYWLVGRLLDLGPEYKEVEGGRRLVHGSSCACASSGTIATRQVSCESQTNMPVNFELYYFCMYFCWFTHCVL